MRRRGARHRVVRGQELLIEVFQKGFRGYRAEGKLAEVLTDEFIESVSERYIELYEQITGENFVKRSYDNINSDIELAVNAFIAELIT